MAITPARKWHYSDLLGLCGSAGCWWKHLSSVLCGCPLKSTSLPLATLLRVATLPFRRGATSANAQMRGPLSGANRKTFVPFVGYATGTRGVPRSSRPEAASLRLIRIRFVVQISARLARRETDCCKGLRSIGDRSMLHSNT